MIVAILLSLAKDSRLSPLSLRHHRSIIYLKPQRRAQSGRVEEHTVGARDEAAQLRGDEHGECADEQSGRCVVNRVRADADLGKTQSAETEQSNRRANIIESVFGEGERKTEGVKE